MNYELIWNESGYQIRTDRATYNLYEGMTVGGMKAYSSDILFIMDDEDTDRPARMVNFIYGAFELDSPACRDKFIPDVVKYIQEYEDRESKIRSIVNRLYDEESGETIEEMENNLQTIDGCYDYLDFTLNTIDSILE